MPSWQSTSRIGCLINNLARRARGAAPSTRPQWTRVPLDFRPRWRYVVNKAGAANAAPALKYKFYFTPHFCGYTEFGIVPKWLTDITEFSIPAGKVYLSPVIDCYDGLIVTWTIGTSPNAELVNTMLDNAIEQLSEDEHPIIHSDR